jgi:threonine aldolase
MVFAKVDKAVDIYAVVAALKEQDIIISPSDNMRLVTHLDISKADIDSFISALKAALI